MPNLTARPRAFDARERESYAMCLEAESVPLKSRPYYISRVAQLLAVLGDRDVALLDERALDELVTAFGRREALQDWQFEQAVDAFRIYFTTFRQAKAAWEVDWTAWKGAPRALAPDHSSAARQHRPEELIRSRARRGTGALADVRRAHEDLIVRLVTEIRLRGYAYRTEQTYEQWFCRYIVHCKGASPEAVGPEGVAGFLDELVVGGNVSASTQNQALNALIFLYKRVLGVAVGQLDDFARSKRKKTVPVVLTRSEVRRVLEELDGWQREIASLLYGTGMRVTEALTLRVKDIDTHVLNRPGISVASPLDL